MAEIARCERPRFDWSKYMDLNYILRLGKALSMGKSNDLIDGGYGAGDVSK